MKSLCKWPSIPPKYLTVLLWAGVTFLTLFSFLQTYVSVSFKKAHMSTLTVLSYEDWTLKLNTLFFSLFCCHFWPAFCCTLVDTDSSVNAPQIPLFRRMLGVSPEARVLLLLIWCVGPQVLRPQANLRSPPLCSVYFSSVHSSLAIFRDTCNRNRETPMVRLISSILEQYCRLHGRNHRSSPDQAELIVHCFFKKELHQRTVAT